MFFVLPTGVDYRSRRLPVVTFTLIGLNTLIYLISLGLNFSKGSDAEWDIMSRFWLTPDESVWYTWLTSLFVHDGFFHLLGNMVYLFLFGSCVEDKIGRWQFSLFYLLGGLVANLTHVLATIGHASAAIPLGGASGAISACMGGFILLYHRTSINFHYFFFFFFRLYNDEFSLPSWLVISFWFLKDAFSAFVDLGSETGSGVAFAAHVGGWVSGMALIAVWKMLPARLKFDCDADDEEPASPPKAVPTELAQPPTIYLHFNGTQHGPFTIRQINEMRQLGSIDGETMFWQDGMADWQSVTELRH